jgi:hypothetical protein
VVEVDRRGAKCGSETIGASGADESKCDYDSGDFTDDRRVSQRIREFYSFYMSFTGQSEVGTKGK